MILRGNEREQKKKNCVDADGLWIYDIISWNTPFSFVIVKTKKYLPVLFIFSRFWIFLMSILFTRTVAIPTRQKNFDLKVVGFRCAAGRFNLNVYESVFLQVNQSLLLDDPKWV